MAITGISSGCVRYSNFMFRSKAKREINRKLRRMCRHFGIPRCSVLLFLISFGSIVYFIWSKVSDALTVVPLGASNSTVLPSIVDKTKSTCWPRYTCILPQRLYTRGGSFDKALDGRSSVESVIYLSIVDMPVVDLARNLYESSYRRHGISNYLFVCTDRESIRILSEHSIKCYDFEQYWNDPRNLPRLPDAFRRKTHIKTQIALSALVLGYTIVMTDVDMVFLKDPYLYLKKHTMDCDMQFMEDADDITTAFYMARPTGASIKAHMMALEWGMAKRDIVTDRRVMIRAVFNLSHSGDLRLRYLKSLYFQDGKTYFEEGMRMFYNDNPCQTCVAVHNNWVFKKHAKIYRMKENLMWFLDDNGYYSSPWTKFITYSNPVFLGNPIETIQQELLALRDALTIAWLLKRVLILPSFHCGHCENDACHNINRQCSLHSYINMYVFHINFNTLYREHVYLSNPRVPDVVRMSASRPIQIYTEKVHLDLDLSMVKHRFFPTNPKEGAEPREIVNWFNQKPFSVYSILHFHSFYGVFAGIWHKEEDEQNEEYRRFYSKLMIGLKEVDYRQAGPAGHNDILNVKH